MIGGYEGWPVEADEGIYDDESFSFELLVYKFDDVLDGVFWTLVLQMISCDGEGSFYFGEVPKVVDLLVGIGYGCD